MPVQFQFSFPRSLATITYIASKDVPELTTYKILKIIFLADKNHLVRYGRTITGDDYSALPDGPVPTRLYNLFRKQVVKRPFSEEGRQILSNVEVDKTGQHPIFIAKKPADMDELSQSDVSAIDQAIKQFGNLKYGELKAITHEMAAFDRAWKSKKLFRNSAPMKFEDFFENDTSAREEAKTEMLETDLVRKALAKSV